MTIQSIQSYRPKPHKHSQLTHCHVDHFKVVSNEKLSIGDALNQLLPEMMKRNMMILG